MASILEMLNLKGRSSSPIHDRLTRMKGKEMTTKEMIKQSANLEKAVNSEISLQERLANSPTEDRTLAILADEPLAAGDWVIIAEEKEGDLAAWILKSPYGEITKVVDGVATVRIYDDQTKAHDLETNLTNCYPMTNLERRFKKGDYVAEVGTGKIWQLVSDPTEATGMAYCKHSKTSTFMNKPVVDLIFLKPGVYEYSSGNSPHSYQSPYRGGSGYTPPKKTGIPQFDDYKWDEPVYINVVGGEQYTVKMTAQEIQRVHDHLDWDLFEVENDGKTKKCIRITISHEQAAYKIHTGSKSVACCAFDATNGFMKAIGFGGLDEADRTWYKNHPLTVASGLQQAYTLGVLEALVQPYGLGISKVFVRRGMALFEEQVEWAEILGINPMAATDRGTSNAAYIASLGELAEVMGETADKYGFEIVEELPMGKPIVSMAGTRQATTGFAGGGGHASYHGPRSKVHDWSMAVQYDRIEKCTRNKPFVPYEEAETQNLILDQSKCLDKNGKTWKETIFNNSSDGLIEKGLYWNAPTYNSSTQSTYKGGGSGSNQHPFTTKGQNGKGTAGTGTNNKQKKTDNNQKTLREEANETVIKGGNLFRLGKTSQEEFLEFTTSLNFLRIKAFNSKTGFWQHNNQYISAHKVVKAKSDPYSFAKEFFEILGYNIANERSVDKKDLKISTLKVAEILEEVWQLNQFASIEDMVDIAKYAYSTDPTTQAYSGEFNLFDLAEFVMVDTEQEILSEGMSNLIDILADASLADILASMIDLVLHNKSTPYELMLLQYAIYIVLAPTVETEQGPTDKDWEHLMAGGALSSQMSMAEIEAHMKSGTQFQILE